MISIKLSGTNLTLANSMKTNHFVYFYKECLVTAHFELMFTLKSIEYKELICMYSCFCGQSKHFDKLIFLSTNVQCMCLRTCQIHIPTYILEKKKDQQKSKNLSKMCSVKIEKYAINYKPVNFENKILIIY